MSHDLSPTEVSKRLARLRDLYVPETEEQARQRLAPEARRDVPFAEAVTKRLAELRALCELTAYLHRGSVPRSRPRIPTR
jgi:hypothetical protein